LGPIVLQSAYNNLKLRYSILKYYYTLFIRNKGKGTIWRPLFFRFPTDDNCYIDSIADTQLLLGNDLMAIPILEPGATSRMAYFPGNKNWYDLHTGLMHRPGNHLIEGIQLTDKVPLFLV